MTNINQGIVWGWLIGPYVTASVRVHGGGSEAREKAAETIDPFRSHLFEAGIGHISEVFDGNAPHTSRGCYAQAWSVGEVLRCYVEDVLGERPEPWFTESGCVERHVG